MSLKKKWKGFVPVWPAGIRYRGGLNWKRDQKRRKFSSADQPAIVSAWRSSARSDRIGTGAPLGRVALQRAGSVSCCVHTDSRTATQNRAFSRATDRLFRDNCRAV